MPYLIYLGLTLWVPSSNFHLTLFVNHHIEHLVSLATLFKAVTDLPFLLVLHAYLILEYNCRLPFELPHRPMGPD